MDVIMKSINNIFSAHDKHNINLIMPHYIGMTRFDLRRVILQRGNCRDKVQRA